MGSRKGLDEVGDSTSERPGESVSCSAKLAVAFCAAPRAGRIRSASPSMSASPIQSLCAPVTRPVTGVGHLADITNILTLSSSLEARRDDHNPSRTTAATLTRLRRGSVQVTTSSSGFKSCPGSKVPGDFIVRRSRGPQIITASRFLHAPLCLHSPHHVFRSSSCAYKHPGSSPPNPCLRTSRVPGTSITLFSTRSDPSTTLVDIFDAYGPHLRALVTCNAAWPWPPFFSAPSLSVPCASTHMIIIRFLAGPLYHH